MRKKIFSKCLPILLALVWSISNTSCKKTEDVKASKVKPEIDLIDFALVAGQNTRFPVVHLHSDTVYILKQNFTRESGEQLIIDAGTLIKANGDVNGSGPAITIQPGGLLTATGEQNNPVVFTSNARAGTQGANWGGIVIQGKSFNNDHGTDGIATDFSGVLKYVRIEFASIALIGVGSETILENVMVSYSNMALFNQYQASYSIYGGTFNARNLVSYACSGPADFFITNGYSGNMQNLIASRHPYFGHPGNGPGNSLAGIFIQNNSNNFPAPKPYTNPVITNLTVVGPDLQNGTPAAYSDTNLLASSLVTTNSACFHIRNSLMLGFPAACWILNDHATAFNLQEGNGELSYSIVQSHNETRCFYLAPGTYDPYNSGDFRNYMLSSLFKNQLYENTAQFMLENISSYDLGPNLMPVTGSPVLSGASYDSSAFYNNAYFDKTETFLGAIGTVNWLNGWTNFVPLKTNYNFPE